MSAPREITAEMLQEIQRYVVEQFNAGNLSQELYGIFQQRGFEGMNAKVLAMGLSKREEHARLSEDLSVPKPPSLEVMMAEENKYTAVVRTINQYIRGERKTLPNIEQKAEDYPISLRHRANK